MTHQADLDHSLTPRYRAAFWMSFPIIAFVTLRKVTASEDEAGLITAVVLLAVYLLLLTTQMVISKRLPGYFQFYLLVQSTLVVALGLLHPYEDTWAVLFIPLAFQLFHELPRRVALAWSAFFALAVLLTLIYTTGWVSGFGFGLFYVASGIFFVAYDYQYAQVENARYKSQALLAGLQSANQELEESALQLEELAAARERENIARQLHDSVNQIIFSITLDAQSVRLLLDKDPQRVPSLLDRLQEQTSRALAQMRDLISQWRTGN
jgi:signal transduction histidine kinase